MRSKRYGPDVLAEGRRRPGRGQIPRVTAERGLVVEDAAGEFCGAVVWCEKDAVDAGGRPRQAAGVPAPAGRLPAWRASRSCWSGRRQRPAGTRRPGAGRRDGPRRDRSRPRRAGPRSRGPAGSTSRAATTPSWSRRSGATTCATSASSWSTSGGIDDLPAIVADFAPRPGAQARRPGRPSGGRVEGDQDRRAGAVTARADRRAPVHRRLGGGQAVGARHPGWPRVPPGSPWKEGVLAAIGWPADTAGRLAAHPALGDVLHGPGTGVPRPGRGTDRLRDVLPRVSRGGLQPCRSRGTPAGSCFTGAALAPRRPISLRRPRHRAAPGPGGGRPRTGPRRGPRRRS